MIQKDKSKEFQGPVWTYVFLRSFRDLKIEKAGHNQESIPWAPGTLHLTLDTLLFTLEIQNADSQS